MIDHELVDKLIIYIGEVENNQPYFTAKEIDIPGYDAKTIEDYVAMLIDGEIIHGVFAQHESAVNCGYLIGGLTLETRYRYRKLKEVH